MSNNGKTERTDSVVREAFLRLTDGDSEEETVQKIHAEKFAIAPDCANCLNPLWQYFRLRYGAILRSRCEDHRGKAGSD